MAAGEPIFNVPRSVLYLIVLMTAIQAIRSVLPEDIDFVMLLSLAFIPARYSGEAMVLPGGYLACITSFVTYMIVHGGWLHLLVNMLWMLAFGSAVARRIGDARFIYFSICSGVVGALTHLAFHFGDQAPVVGASAAISGQMAGAIRFIFRFNPGPGRGATDVTTAPLASLGQTLTDPRILLFLLIWVVLNIAFGLSALPIAGVPAQGSVAWEAHIGGFLFGLLCFGLFDRPKNPDSEAPDAS
jgi:membrane associated rhomboid family serine protease